MEQFWTVKKDLKGKPTETYKISGFELGSDQNPVAIVKDGKGTKVHEGNFKKLMALFQKEPKLFKRMLVGQLPVILRGNANITNGWSGTIDEAVGLLYDNVAAKERQAKELTKVSAALEKSIRMLYELGQGTDDIAMALGLDEAQVKAVVEPEDNEEDEEE